MNDPIRAWRRRILLTWLIGTVAVALLCIWALRAPAGQSVQAPDFSTFKQSDPTENNDATELDPAVFNVALWNPPPPENPPPKAPGTDENSRGEQKPTKPPRDLKIQLVAIVRDGKERRAALYDASTQRLAIFKEGQVLKSGPTVATVTDGYVDLKTGDQLFRLSLRAKDRS